MQANGTSQASQATGADKQNHDQPERPGGSRKRRPSTRASARSKGARSQKANATASTAKANEAAKKAKGKPSGPREGSTMWAAMEVLRGRRNPMAAGEIYAEIKRRNLAPGLKGKTPEQTVGAALAVHAKRGVYVQRAGRGKFRLRKGG